MFDVENFVESVYELLSEEEQRLLASACETQDEEFDYLAEAIECEINYGRFVEGVVECLKNIIRENQEQETMDEFISDCN